MISFKIPIVYLLANVIQNLKFCMLKVTFNNKCEKILFTLKAKNDFN